MLDLDLHTVRPPYRVQLAERSTEELPCRHGPKASGFGGASRPPAQAERVSVDGYETHACRVGAQVCVRPRQLGFHHGADVVARRIEKRYHHDPPPKTCQRCWPALRAHQRKARCRHHGELLQAHKGGLGGWQLRRDLPGGVVGARSRGHRERWRVVADRGDNAGRRRTAGRTWECSIERRTSQGQQGDTGQRDHDEGPGHLGRPSCEGGGPVGPLWY